MSASARWLGALRLEVQVPGEATGGAFCLLVDEPQPGWALPPHRHRFESETIHIVTGEFELVVDGEPRTMGPGDTAHVPSGALHSGRLLSDTPGRRVLVFSPAGIEGFFLDAGTEERDAPVDGARVFELAQRYGFDFETA